MAEALLNHLGQGRFRAYSAGSHPDAVVQPMEAELIAGLGLPTAQLRTRAGTSSTCPAHR